MTDPSHPATRTIVRAGTIVSRKMRSYRLRIETPGGEPRTQTVTRLALRVGSKEGNDVVLADASVSRVHLEIVVDDHGYRLRDLESRNGTFVDGYRANDMYLRAGSVIRLGDSQLRFEPLNQETDVPISPSDRFGPLVGVSTPMREMFASLEKVAPTTATVLIEGETGTGKELVARALHEASPRAHGPFVVLDCAAVATNLLESEVFGHERGAFTDASERRIGRLEEADKGTLFIDELGELPIDLQPKLLRALERREVRRLGGNQTLSVDIRIVAATNRDLAKEVNRGTFREDLYYRLAVVRIGLPPLRERPEDIRRLVEHFVHHALRREPARAERVLGGISEENWKRLMTHPWPGNVRELKNVIERTLALSTETSIQPMEPNMPARSPTRASRPSDDGLDIEQPFTELKAQVLAQFEEEYLTRQLDRHGGNISRAAVASGLDRMYFKRLLRKYR